MGRGKRKARPEVYLVLANVIRDRRQGRGWRQLDLAIALGVHVRQVKRWESGVHVPHPRTYEHLVRVLGFTLVDTVRLRRAASGLSLRHVPGFEFTDLHG